MPRDLTVDEQETADRFGRAYYDAGAWHQVRWMGVEAFKYPTDLFVYAELIYEVRPDLICETGSHRGGSALFFAHMMDIAGITEGRVFTIDVNGEDPAVEQRPDLRRPKHPRIHYVRGSSTDPAVVDMITAVAASARTVMVVLDSDHSEAHVRAEMDAYAPLVTVGSYLVVEDTNLGGHPVVPGWGPGPWDAVHTFLDDHPGGWEQDRFRERFHLTSNPGGWLRRLR